MTWSLCTHISARGQRPVPAALQEVCDAFPVAAGSLLVDPAMEAALVRVLIHGTPEEAAVFVPSRDLSVPALLSIGVAARLLMDMGGPRDVQAVLRAAECTLGDKEAREAWVHYELGFPDLHRFDAAHAREAQRLAGRRKLRGWLVGAVIALERFDDAEACRLAGNASDAIRHARQLRTQEAAE